MTNIFAFMGQILLHSKQVGFYGMHLPSMTYIFVFHGTYLPLMRNIFASHGNTHLLQHIPPIMTPTRLHGKYIAFYGKHGRVLSYKLGFHGTYSPWQEANHLPRHTSPSRANIFTLPVHIRLLLQTYSPIMHILASYGTYCLLGHIFAFQDVIFTFYSTHPPSMAHIHLLRYKIALHGIPPPSVANIFYFHGNTRLLAYIYLLGTNSPSTEYTHLS